MTVSSTTGVRLGLLRYCRKTALRVAEELNPQLVHLIAPLPQLGLRVLGCVHAIDASLRFLLY
jgi:hypothetical protein